VRVNALCPEYIETPLGRAAQDTIAEHLKMVGGFIPMSLIVEGRPGCNVVFSHSQQKCFLQYREREVAEDTL
jgi:NAD(P)-dependent dehydrogenase (short-subunit alcohol dehydrogenase family)